MEGVEAASDWRVGEPAKPARGMEVLRDWVGGGHPTESRMGIGVAQRGSRSFRGLGGAERAPVPCIARRDGALTRDVGPGGDACFALCCTCAVISARCFCIEMGFLQAKLGPVVCFLCANDAEKNWLLVQNAAVEFLVAESCRRWTFIPFCTLAESRKPESIRSLPSVLARDYAV